MKQFAPWFTGFLAAAWCCTVQAMDITKADNNDALNTPGSWVGGAVPGAGDRAYYTLNATARTNDLGGNLSWQGIVLNNNTKAWTVNGTSTLTLGSGGIDMTNAGANLSLNPPVALGANQSWTVAGSRTLTVAGVLSGNAALVLTKDGNGTLTVNNGNNTYNGTIVVNAGTLGTGGKDNALGTGLLTLKTGSILSLAGGAIANPVVIPAGQNATITGNARLDGTITGGGSLTHGGSGAFTLTLSADNSGYYGNITNTATIALGHKRALGTGMLYLKDDPANPGVNSSLSAKADFLRYDAITNNIVLQNNASIGSSNCTGDFELAGVLSGSGGLTVNHASVTLTLSGNNTYTGATEIAQGGLVILGSLASPLITADNATTLSGNGTVKAVVMNAGSALKVGGYTPDNMKFQGNLTLASGSTTTVKVFGTASYDTFTGAGNATVTRNGTILINFNSDLAVAAGQQFNVDLMFPGWQSKINGAGFNIQTIGLPGGLGITTSGSVVTIVAVVVDSPVLPAEFPIAMTYHGPFTDNNTLEEELLKYASVEIIGAIAESAWDAVASTYPDKMLLKQSAWGSDIATPDKASIFPGHLLLMTGTKLTANATASDTVLYVDDYKKIAKDQAAIDSDNANGKALYVLIYKLDAGNQPDWSQAEHAIVRAINPDHSFVVERAQFGGTPLAFENGKAVMAKHMLFWSGQWQLNFSLQCPRGGPLNLTAAEWFAHEIKRVIDESGADGVEFDVARWSYGSLANHPMDCDNDLVTDYGMVDGVQSFGLGGQVFVRELRKLLGNGKIIQMDSNAPSMQRGRKYVNGCQMESFPNANDYTTFSQAFRHLRQWTEEATPLPKFSYAYVKTTTTTMAGMVDIDGSDLDWHFRVGFASGLLAGMPSPFTSITDPDFIPDDDVNNGTTEGSGAAIWKWDEFVGGDLNDWKWLGQPVGPAVQVLDNVGGTDLLASATWNWTAESGFVAVNQAANGTYTANMTAIPNSTVVAPGDVGTPKYFTGTIPKVLAFGNRLEITAGAPLLQNGTEYTLEFEARGNDEWNYGGEYFEEVPRALNILTPQDNKTLSILLAPDWQPVRLSFFATTNQTLVFGFAEQIGEAGIRNIRLYQGGADRWKREFENGIVLLNMSKQPWTPAMGGAYRRLTGTQNPDINNGQRVPPAVTVPVWDAVFLARTDPTDVVIPDGGNFTVPSEGYLLGAQDTLSGNGTVTGGDLVAVAGASINAGANGTAGTLSFSNNLTLNGQSLVFDLTGDPEGNNDRIDVAGGVALNGNTTISLNLLSGFLGNGTYTLMTYASRQGGTFVLDASYPNATLSVGPTSVTLIVTGEVVIPLLYWTGNSTNPVWDVGTTANWLHNGFAAVYQDGADVRFDDTATNNTVSLAASVVPFKVAVGAEGNTTISGSGGIGGLAPLHKTGNGVLTLSTNNTFSGGVLLDAGILRLGSPAANGTCTALGTGTLSVAEGTVLTSAYNTAGGAQRVANDITVDGNFTLGASGFTAPVDYTGNIALGSQERILAVINATNNSTFWSCLSGSLSGTGGLVKEGGGGLQLGNGTQNSTFSGDVTVRNGTLTVYNQAAIGGSNKTIYMNGGTIGVAGTQALSLSNNIVVGGNFTLRGVTNASVTLNGPVNLGAADHTLTSSGITAVVNGDISGIGGLTLADNWSANATLPSCVFTGNNSMAGNLTLGATVWLSVNRTEALGNGSTVFINQNANLFTTANMTLNQNIDFVAGGANPTLSVANDTTLTINGSLGGGSGSPRKDTGGGMLVLNGAGAFTNNASVFLLQNGGIRIGNAAALNGTSLKFNGGVTLDNTSGSSTLTGLTGVLMTSGFTFTGTNDLDLSGIETGFVQTQNSTRTINVAAGKLTLGAITTSDNFAYSGTVKAKGSLSKSGNGTLVLVGASDYIGNATNNATTINAGTLLVNNPTGSGTGSVDVKVTGNGTLGGYGTIAGNVSVEANGGLAFALVSAPGSHDRLDIGGSLAFNGTTNLTITSSGNATTGNYTLVTAAGGITGSAPGNLNLPSGWNATTAIAGNNLVLNVAYTGAAPPANVAFTAAVQNVQEAAGTAILTVQASGSPTGTITAKVTFDSGNSTASAADIGSYTTQTVTLNATNSYTASVTVTVTDDASPEVDETAVFALADLTGPAVLASPSTHTLTILANDSFITWASGYNVTVSLTANDDADKFVNGEEYAFDLDPTFKEYGNVLASTTGLTGGNVTMTLAFNGNSSRQDINYVVRRANNPTFTGNTVVGQWNGTANWTTSNATYFANETQTGAGDVKAINVKLSLPAASEPRQFLKVNIE